MKNTKITYGKVSYHTTFVKNGNITPTNVSDCYQEIKSVDITYNYNVPYNTYENSQYEQITKKEFYSRIKAVKQKHNINFTIKTK